MIKQKDFSCELSDSARLVKFKSDLGYLLHLAFIVNDILRRPGTRIAFPLSTTCTSVLEQCGYCIRNKHWRKFMKRDASTNYSKFSTVVCSRDCNFKNPPNHQIRTWTCDLAFGAVLMTQFFLDPVFLGGSGRDKRGSNPRVLWEMCSLQGKKEKKITSRVSHEIFFRILRITPLFLAFSSACV